MGVSPKSEKWATIAVCKQIKYLKFGFQDLAMLESSKQDEWQSDAPPESLQAFQAYGLTAMARDKRITIRISSRDLEELQIKALEEGMPYQTLITSILHKYVSGRLTEESS
jgi:predicted DNA binding CopG/RHH family protein